MIPGMGFDLRMAPVLLGSGPLRAIRESPDLFEEAAWRPPFSRPSRFGEPLPAVSRELLDLLPEGFREPEWYPSRGHEQAEYLLDPVGRRRIGSWAERERSLPYRVVHGDRPFAEHARAGQGVAWRCSTAGFLAEAGDRIDALDVAAVRREFSVAEMIDLGVYKAQARDDDEEAFDQVLSELRWLACVHRRAVGAGLDLIMILD